MKHRVYASVRRVEWVRVGTGTYVACVDGKLTSWRATRNDNEPSGSEMAWVLTRSEADNWPPAKESWALKGLTTWLTSHLERQPGMREVRDDTQTMRQVIDEELYDWAEYPFGMEPGYLAPIASDAQVDLHEVRRQIGEMRRYEHKDEARVDRLHHQVGRLIEYMREQVSNASPRQIEKYTRAREEWIGS